MEKQNIQNVAVVPQLRPIGNLLKDSFLLIYKHWAPVLIAQGILFFGTIIITVFAVLIFLTPLLVGAVKGMEGEELMRMFFTSYFWIALIVIVVPIIIIAAWAMASIISALGFKGNKMAPVGESLRMGLKLLPPFLLLSVLVYGATIGGCVLLIFPAVILTIGLSLSWYIKVLEDVSIFQAIGTSWEITKGLRWSIFGRFMLFMLMTWVAAMLLAVMGALPFMGIIAAPAQIALNFIITPYALSYFYHIYTDLRSVRKEVYPMSGGLITFMIVCWISAVAAFSGWVILMFYVINKYAS